MGKFTELNTQQIVNELHEIAKMDQKDGYNEYDMCNVMLEFLDVNREEVQFDVALRKVYRELNLWSRTEDKYSGETYDYVCKLLGFNI